MQYICAEGLHFSAFHFIGSSLLLRVPFIFLYLDAACDSLHSFIQFLLHCVEHQPEVDDVVCVWPFMSVVVVYSGTSQ